ncbi:MAG: hypothetical protein HRT38_09485 [Alteromonadaceae bacterium]|nr:hypothetical protein [Alteromonadaceae bacterium]
MLNKPWIKDFKKILSLAIPLIIANIAMIGMEVVDTIMAEQKPHHLTWCKYSIEEPLINKGLQEEWH